MNAELSGNKIQSFPFSKLRIIPYGIFKGDFNMACDVFLAQQVSKTKIPILRFYGWQPFCLSLGYHQKTTDVDFQQLKNDNVDLVRRPTGGSAILHAEELTYSFIAPNTQYSHHTMYAFFHEILAKVLQSLDYPVSLSSDQKNDSYLNKGIDTFACFNRSAKSEIQYEGKKVIGSAQKVYKDSILQHGSIIISDKQERIIEYLNLSTAEKEEQLNILKSNSMSLKEILDHKISEIILSKIIIEEFSKKANPHIFYQFLRSDEMESIRLLVYELKE